MDTPADFVATLEQTAAPEGVVAACQAANAAEFIEGFRFRYGTHCGGKGSQLSGGQRREFYAQSMGDGVAMHQPPYIRPQSASQSLAPSSAILASCSAMKQPPHSTRSRSAGCRRHSTPCCRCEQRGPMMRQYFFTAAVLTGPRCRSKVCPGRHNCTD